MSRNDGLKAVSYRIDRRVAERFDEFCLKHPGDPKQWVFEFALDWVTKLKDPDFRRLYEPFFEWRSIRKREIKIEQAKQREKNK